MLNKIRKSQGGFTLVEIMIVVAIIALLAAIAVPGFLRARKRSQATAVLNDARILDGAKDQYAIENSRKGADVVDWSMLVAHLKPNTRLYTACKTGAPTDVVGGAYSVTSFDSGIKVDTNTESAFGDVIEDATAFWGSYYQ